MYIGTKIGPVRVGTSTRRRRKTPTGPFWGLFIAALAIVWPLTAMGVSFGVAFSVFLGLCVLGTILVQFGAKSSKKPAKPRGSRRS